ncbi:GNAT family N-acetyltransferase [Primorskyibacter sp. S187A]|uniref:GNAT family N-acetyltransferase n=1 Tax=Primorskyibacter sp. S187A TaxID=3415130 RepID=UPI003C7BF669
MRDSTFLDVPAGHIATVVTHLEMTSQPVPAPEVRVPSGLEIVLMDAPDLAQYRALFREIGAQWLWNSRLWMADEKLSALLTHPEVEPWVLRRDGRDVGVLELDFRQAGACELALFGLAPSAIGRGAGRALISFGINRAFARDISRFHLHTCTLDSPQALGFYRRSGFAPVRQEVEIMPDPRLHGLLPREMAPHIPITS